MQRFGHPIDSQHRLINLIFQTTFFHGSTSSRSKTKFKTTACAKALKAACQQKSSKLYKANSNRSRKSSGAMDPATPFQSYTALDQAIKTPFAACGGAKGWGMAMGPMGYPGTSDLEAAGLNQCRLLINMPPLCGQAEIGTKAFPPDQRLATQAAGGTRDEINQYAIFPKFIAPVVRRSYFQGCYPHK